MRTFVTILAVAGGIVVLLLVAVAIAVWAVDPNEFVGPVTAQIKATTGRDVAIGGGIELKLGLQPKLVAKDVRFGNAPWAKGPDMISAKSVEAQVALLPLLRRRFELVRLNLVEPRIALETNAQGVGNWELGKPAAAGAPGAPQSEPATTLGIGNLGITRGNLTYRDGATGAETHVVIDELSVHARDPSSPVTAEFRGSVDGIAVALTGNLGPLATLVERRLPYPIAVEGEIAGRKASVAVKMHRADGLVDLQDLDVTSGASNVKGRVQIREGKERDTWTVDLNSKSLAVEDLPVPGAAPADPKRSAAQAGTGGAQTHLVFSDAPLPLAALRKHDASGDIAVERLTLPGGRALSQVRAKFTLGGGRLEASDLHAGALGGDLSGALTVDARTDTPNVALRVDGRGLDLVEILRMANVKREVRGGKTELNVDVAMRGDSLHKWMSTANGRVRVVIGPATLVNTKAEAGVALDELTQAVNPFRSVSPSTELRCAVIRLPLAGGVARVDRSIGAETQQIDVTASGTLDFRNETLDLSINPRVKQGIKIEIPQIAQLVRFRGPFASPTVHIDAVASAAAIAQIGAAVSTGGLSVLGQSLLSNAAPAGPGACSVALGAKDAAPAPTTSAGAARQGGQPQIADDIGKALGKLLGR